MNESQYIRILVSDKTFIVAAYILIDYTSFIWVFSLCRYYDSKMPYVFLGGLIDGSNPDYIKNTIDHLIRDLKCACWDNAVKANVANKPREQKNAHNLDDNENTNVVD